MRFLSVLLLGCTQVAPAPTGATAPPALHGERSAARIAAPTFSALNQKGEQRGRDDLLGHPTVLWFYPAAATAG
jgi:hypothetical protein